MIFFPAVTAGAVTNSAGEYEFVTVSIGDYKVTADAPGFSSATTDTFNVAVSARQRVDLKLQVGEATGLPSSQNNFIMDGMDHNYTAPAIGAHTTVRPSLD